MFEIISRETRDVTPEDASRLLEYNTYKAQRPLRKSHVAILAKVMKVGDFTTGNLAFAEDSSGVVRLMNGQHQLSAIVRSGKTIVAHIEHAKCPEYKDIAKYFSQFDVGANRSISDIVRTEVDTVGVGWLKLTGSILVGAISLVDAKGNYRNIDRSLTKHERARKIRYHIKDGNYLNELFTGNEAKFLRRTPVAAVILMTYKKFYPTSYDFWTGVKSGVNLGAKDPRLHIRNFLMTSVVVGSAATVARRATDKEIIVRCIHAWNAYARGEERSQVSSYHADAVVPRAVKPNGVSVPQTD